MQTVPNVSSEEELSNLHKEGKISEDEYQQLLAALRESSPNNDEALSGKPEACPIKTELRAFRKRVLITGMIICVTAVPLGFVLNIPLVWGLGIFGIIVIPIKTYLLNR